MNYIQVEVNPDNRVAVLTMNYKKENYFNPAMLDELFEALEQMEEDRSVGAVVITGGDPKYFSNGLDLEYLKANFKNPEKLKSYLPQVNRVFKKLTLFPKPTVAALNGHAFAGGFLLAAHMDFRFMRADRGWVCLPEVDINIPLLPAMIAICEHVMSRRGFRLMYYSGKKLTATEALETGFLDGMFEIKNLLPECISFAASLARKNTRTYAEMKRRLKKEVVRNLDEEDPKAFGSALSFVKI